jgi:integrase
MLDKPEKPYAAFPLTPHNSGKWAKKIRGKSYYFGRWEDPDGALREYNGVKDSLLAGRKPVSSSPASKTVRELFNAFLDRQLARVDAGRLEPRSYQDNRSALQEFARAVGPARVFGELKPADFGSARSSFAGHLGPHALSRSVTHVKSAINYGIKNGLIVPPILFGDRFDKETKKTLRMNNRKQTYISGKKLFSPRECRMILDAADEPLRTMVLLGLNCGFYAVDIAGLPVAALDLDNAWVEFPRQKTEVDRMSPLWPETVMGLRKAIGGRNAPKHADDAGTLFITKYGNRWMHNKVHRDETGISKVSRVDAISQRFHKLLVQLGIDRPRIGFSALRHTFRTVAEQVQDTNAARLIMGHSFPAMEEFYVRDVAKKRLGKVVNHVRQILLNPEGPMSRTKEKLIPHVGKAPLNPK